MDARLLGQQGGEAVDADRFLLLFKRADVLRGQQQIVVPGRLVEGVGAGILLIKPRNRAGKPVRFLARARHLHFAIADAAAAGTRVIERLAHLLTQMRQQERSGFAAQFTDQLFIFLVIQHDMIMLIEQANGDLSGIDHRFDHRFLVLHLPFQTMHFGDIAMHAKEMAGFTVHVNHRRDGEIGQIAAAIMAAVNQQAVPGALPLQLRP